MSQTADQSPRVLDVAIVGGGIAGTYAAYRLRHANRRIGLFEYSSRIGGRMFTYHLPCSPSIDIELGAMRFVPKQHRILNSLIEELGVPVIPFSKKVWEREPTTHYYIRGQHFSVQEFLHGQVPFALNAQEKENQHRLLNYYLEKLLDLKDERSAFERSCDPDVAAKLESLPFETAIDFVASPEGKAFIQATRSHTSPVYFMSKASALMGFRTISGFSSQDTVMTLKDGMSTLPLKLFECFKESNEMHRTFLNHKLISIRKTEGKQYALKFQLTFSEDDDFISDVKDSFYETVAKKVILALPISALGAIEWTPFQEISFQRTKAFTENASVCKIFLAFNHPWWRDCEKSSSITISDQTYTCSIEFGSHGGTYVLMASFSSCTHTFRALQSRGKSIQGSAPGDMRVSIAMKDFLLDQLSLTFGIVRSKIPDPVGGVAKFWDSSQLGGLQVSKSGFLNQGVLRRIQRPMPDEDVVVVGTDVAAEVGSELWVEGALQVVDEALSRNPFLLSKC